MRFHKLEGHLRGEDGQFMMGGHEVDFAAILAECQKFYCGDVGALPHTPITTFPRLPYALCAFEFSDVDPSGSKQPFIVMAEDLLPYGQDTVRMHVFVPFSRDLSFWIHSGWGMIHPSKGTRDIYLNRRTMEFFKEYPGYEHLANGDAMQTSIEAASYWLAKFLEVLNCSNVQIEEIAQPPKLNKQRCRRGKLPLYSYKVLVLKSRSKRLATVGNGSHESPRIHLRRGHVKRRKTGSFWWQPHVVGEKSLGIVSKEYRADKMMDAA